MPRGGKRSPAGGRPTIGLDDYTKISVGIMCEERWTRLGKREGSKRLNEQYPALELTQVSRDNMLAISVEKRTTSPLVREYINDIEKDMKDTPNYYKEPFIRPHGKKDLVLKTVSRWASRKYGIRISPRAVKTCWDEYRKFQKNS
jgi:hypothetical protein